MSFGSRAHAPEQEGSESAGPDRGSGQKHKNNGRIGATPTLLVASLIQMFIITGMAWIQSPVIAILLVFRSVPRGLMQAPLNAEIVPLVGEGRRATYLSIQSLLGRLILGAVLLTFSFIFDGNEIAALIRVSAIGAAIGLVLLTAACPSSKRRDSTL